MFGKKFLFDHHELVPERIESRSRHRGFFYFLALWFEKITFFNADIALVPNESTRQIAIRRGHMLPEKVFIVRASPSLERSSHLPLALHLRHGKKYLVVFAGWMGEHQGINYLIEAASHIVHGFGRTQIHFTFVGHGPALEDFIYKVHEKKLENFVTFTGQANDQVLFENLNNADICVNPDEVNPLNDKSTWNRLIDYMAFGKPIVQFDMTEGRFLAGGASFNARANDAVDFADKIIELIDNPQKRATMGAVGRARFERELAWSSEIPKLLAAYQAVFAS